MARSEQRPMQARFVVTLSAVVALASYAAADQTRAPARASKQVVKVETYAKGLVHPWALAVLPDGRLLVTERPGRMRLVGKDGRLSPPLGNVPPVWVVGQGGLLDVAVAPDFASSKLVYFSYSEPRESGGSATTVARAMLALDGEGGQLDDVQTIFRQQPVGFGGLHFGSRLTFASDGSLFVTLGERGQRDRAQDLSTHYGKVVRLRPDGSVPSDNPFMSKGGVSTGGARPENWSYGHRNAQAAALHPATGRLWTIEHGARGGDELNIPLAGRNYGWPVITYGRDYSGARIGEGTAKAGMEQPLYYWDPSIAPSGMAFYTGDLFPEWKGSLFVGALRGQALHRLVLDGDRVVGEEVLLKDRGERIRDVRAGPDGALWLVTDDRQGLVLRVVPAS
jgi:aldose sugar dehydrogenase